MSSEFVKREILVPKAWNIPEDAVIEAYHAAADTLLATWKVPEPYTFPAFLPDGWWIAMDSSGKWYCYPSQPEWDGTMWFGQDRREHAIENWIVWTPPTVKDAASSLMQVRHESSIKEKSKG